jgi:hypothetical protein
LNNGQIVDINAFRAQHQSGKITAFVALCFDVITFAPVVELVSFDESAVDTQVEQRNKQGLEAIKETFVVKFDGSWAKNRDMTDDMFMRFHDFGALYAHGLTYFDSDEFKVVPASYWTFDESIIDAEVKKMTKKGIKAAKLSRIIRFRNAFVTQDVSPVAA